MQFKINFTAPFFALVLASVAACGGSNDTTNVSSTTITGTVFAAPVSGASVVVKNESGNNIAGPVVSGTEGDYSVNVPSSTPSSDFRITSTGGAYSDEATGAATTAGTLAAYVSGGSMTAGTVVNLTPASTIVHDLVTQHGKSPLAALDLFGAAFGYQPDLSVTPKNGPTTGSDGPQRLAALHAAALSQLTKDMGLAPRAQFDMIAALSRDLSDGSLDGKQGSSPVSISVGANMPENIQNRFEHAFVSLMSNTAANRTGLMPDQIGSLPFAKVAFTNTYRVEYIPGMMAATQGKTAFKLKITYRSDGSPISGLSVALMPLMHMSTRNHATPVDAVVDNGDGTYSCTVYYLMASGMGMGYWELKIKIGGMTGETATFFPSVGMAMGADTMRATLKGQNDIISSMTGTEKRSYYLFKDGMASAAAGTMKLFIAAKESMMSYPAVSLGTVLSSPTGTVTSMTVQGSSDGGMNWVQATDVSGGHWSLSGLAGLVLGQTGTVLIKLNVNGEDKTTDGNAPSGANAYATFSVTPGM